MKNTTLTALGLFLLTTLSAQDSRMIPAQRNYMFTVAPAALLTGKVAVAAEINTGNRSVHVMAGIPVMRTFNYTLDGSNRSIQTKTFSMYGGYRFYFGQKEGRGFYAEPYAKCVDNHAWTTEIFTVGKTPGEFAVKSDFDAKGIGAQLGVQFWVAKRIVVDWYIAGPEINLVESEIAARQLGEGGTWDETAMNDAMNEISHMLKDVPYLGEKMSFSTDANKRVVSATFKGALPALRTGIAIGFRF